MPITVHNRVIVSFGEHEVTCEKDHPLTLLDALDIFPSIACVLDYDCSTPDFADEICDVLREASDLEGSHEHLFLLLYFNRLIEKLKTGLSLSNALLPLPQARVSIGQQKPISADFIFWTGERFVAIFIHESPYDRKTQDETSLRTWGFEVFSLMAPEFEMRGLMGDTGIKILRALGLV
jgi:hypothetical protein